MILLFSLLLQASLRPSNEKASDGIQLELLNAAVESHPGLLIAVNDALQITLWNKQAQQRFLRFRETAVGRYLYEVVPSFSHEYALQFLRQALSHGILLELVLNTDEGKLPLLLQPLKNQHGKITGLVIASLSMMPAIDAAVNVL